MSKPLKPGELNGPDTLRKARNSLVGWEGFQAECVESPDPTKIGEFYWFGGDYIIVKATRKYFYFFLDADQERYRVERSKVLHSPVGKVVYPE